MTIDRDALDQILTLQLLIGWAGEGKTDPPRLGWWRTALVDEFGGEDLFKRLTPRTWRWAVLEAARLAARKVDTEARAQAADRDQLRSLYHFGFELDEQLDDRLAELKRTVEDPVEALPDLAPIAAPWDREALRARLAALGKPDVVGSAIGRRLRGHAPSDPVTAARALAAAHVPFDSTYPAPHVKVSG